MVSKVENIEYFNLKYNTSAMSLQKYTHLFPRVCKRDDPVAGRCSLLPDDDEAPAVRADVSPHYLANPYLPQRIREVFPDSRFLVILRNPTHRAISQFNMWWQLTRVGQLCSKGADCNFAPWNASKQAVAEVKGAYLRELEALVDTLTQELAMCHSRHNLASLAGLEDCLDLRGRPNGEVHSALDRVSFIWYSMYADQLTHWFDHFKPTQFLFWSSSDFHANPEAHMSQLVEWLGLPLADINPELPLNRNIGSAMYITKIPKELIARLNNFFKPHSDRLYQLLQRKGFPTAAMKMKRDFHAVH